MLSILCTVIIFCEKDFNMEPQKHNSTVMGALCDGALGNFLISSLKKSEKPVKFGLFGIAPIRNSVWPNK